MQGDFPISGSRSHRVGSGLDAIRDHFVLCPMKSIDSCDDHSGGASTLYLGPHGDEKVSQICNFRFASGTLDDRHSFGKCSGHHDVGSPKNRWADSSSEKNLGSLQTSRLGVNVAFLNVNLCSQCLEALEVQVNGACADDAATGH